MLNYILLQAENSATGGTVGSIVMIVLIFVVFYFFMICPQQKKQKELQKQREAMKKGDKVVTAGGIYGIIKDANATTFLVEVAKDVTIKVDKASVYASADDAQQAPKEEPKAEKK
ncbi:MAG: preprotein translocase subunit YajC [Paludibacter sp.]|nr:preprotein translocase subunit YajC [Bacteroidales bacterium]MCM1069437.1 preprotein translocase subunit YajC [Prevotella sp.]MCM1353811.1 preprotein translocase subunit YajC [Bacteroides sp.]MCM1442788.1 preprotein translocase subunit YajC [Muribaculum sp.]MCM1481846.1 preprotein translocase subunit YajC [Paludibacter sp.]